MKLLTKEIKSRLPELYATDGQGFKAVAQVKLFNPWSRYTLFVTEYDGDDTLYGFCLSALGADCDEWGYTSLSDLESLKHPHWGCPAIERDMYWDPRTIEEAIDEG